MTGERRQSETERTQYRLRMTLRDPEAVRLLTTIGGDAPARGTLDLYSQANFILDETDKEYLEKKWLLDTFRTQVEKYNRTPFPTRGPVEVESRVTIRPGQTTVREGRIGLPVDFGAQAGHWLYRAPFLEAHSTNNLPVFRFILRNFLPTDPDVEIKINRYLQERTPSVKLGSLALIGHPIKERSNKPEHSPHFQPDDGTDAEQSGLPNAS